MNDEKGRLRHKMIMKAFSFNATLTISPFLNLGGSHEMIIFVLDDGIAFILCGADGTVNSRERFS
jgi:hypothetical protein